MKVHDEVCGMTIDSDEAATSFEFQGRRYYFCSQRCRVRFEEHPGWYVEVETSPDDEGVGHGAA